MKQFKDFGIKPAMTGFVGNSIDINRILNREVIVHKFSVGPSKKKENTQCLTLQIEIDNSMRVIFSGSKFLIDMIQRVPTNEFPFKAKIEKRNDHFEFT